MRRLCCIIVLVLCAVSTTWAQNPDELFQKANGLYQENKIAEARDLYESIVSNGYVSVGLACVLTHCGSPSIGASRRSSPAANVRQLLAMSRTRRRPSSVRR